MSKHRAVNLESRNEANRYQKFMGEVGRIIIFPDIPIAFEFFSDANYHARWEQDLASLDGSLVPRPTDKWDNPAALQRLCSASNAINRSTGVLCLVTSLPHAAFPGLQEYLARVTGMFLERWEGVTKWMVYLVENIDKVAILKEQECDRATTALQKCADMVLALLQSRQTDLLSELLSMPCTINLLITLLCHMSADNTTYQLWPPFTSPGATCTITELIYTCWVFYRGGRDSAVLAMKSCKPQTRRRIFTAVINRVQQMATCVDEHEHANQSRSIFQLVGIVVTLAARLDVWPELDRSGIFSHLTAAVITIIEKMYLAKVTDEQHWNSLTRATSYLAWSAVYDASDSVAFLPPLIKSGLLRAALLCYPYSKWNSRPSKMDVGPWNYMDALEMLLPYLYLRPVLFAAKEYGGVWEVIDAEVPIEMHNGGEPEIWDDVCDAMAESWNAHLGEPRLGFSMCSNVKHLERFYVVDHMVKACSGCHWVTYCSEACQMEDWNAFHRFECHSAAVNAKENNLWSVKTVNTIRHSQLAWLHHAVNDPENLEYLLETKSEVVKQGDASIAVLKFAHARLDVMYSSVTHLQSIDCTIDIRKTSDAGEWEARYAHFVKEVQADESTMLCEGFFWFTAKFGLKTLVKIRYFPGEEEGTRWRIVGSVFRLTPNAIPTTLQESLMGA